MNMLVAKRSSFVPDTIATRIMVLICDGVSLTTLSSTLEPFQHANTMLGWDKFQLQLVSLRDQDPITKAGIPISCEAQSSRVLEQGNILQRPDQVILCSGQVLAPQDTRLMRDFIQKLALSGIPFFAIGAVSVPVAAAGLIKTKKCAAHWKTIAPLEESFPGITFENVLFAGDDKIMSCAGELASFDLITGFIEKICGPRVSGEICNYFLASARRGGATTQLLNGDALICKDKRFQQVLGIMIDTIETPLSTAEIARRVGLSTRQIERIFARYGFDPPLKYYLRLRLTRAQQLMEQTCMSLTEVAFACGFDSFPSFSKNYKRVFGVSPKCARAGLSS